MLTFNNILKNKKSSFFYGICSLSFNFTNNLKLWNFNFKYVILGFFSILTIDILTILLCILTLQNYIQEINAVIMSIPLLIGKIFLYVKSLKTLNNIDFINSELKGKI